MKIKLHIAWHIIGLLFYVAPAFALLGFVDNNASVWDELRHQFVLDHKLSEPAVQQQLHWLVNHPQYLQKLTQSEPYIYHIITEIKKRQMPG